MDFEELRATFESIQSNTALSIAHNLYARTEALDTLSFINEVIDNNPGESSLAEMRSSLLRVQTRLHKINQYIFNETRDMLKTTSSDRSSIRALFDAYTSYQAGKDSHLHIDYEALDILIAGVFFPQNLPDFHLELEPGMVH
ncbi:MAG: hypothetical protein P1S60_20075, partial [Anaerolineae bacterium]|nr:hypothetical protein [Anaerolineae bacterium]